VRRPFLVGASLRKAERAQRSDWIERFPDFETPIDERTRLALMESWLQDALEEHASVAAFARFAMQLLAVGAPSKLVAGAQRAGLDEIRHARACFGLARRYASVAAGPSALEVADAMQPVSLAELAMLNAEEGLVGETLGAILAAEQLNRTTDPVVAAVLRRISADEARHTELAWGFAAWAVEQGGDTVRAAIAPALEHALRETLKAPILRYDVDLELWHAHGRLTCEEARAIALQGIREVVEPCAGALLGTKRAEWEVRADA
jgi:hypothetical protein